MFFKKISQNIDILVILHGNMFCKNVQRLLGSLTGLLHMETLHSNGQMNNILTEFIEGKLYIHLTFQKSSLDKFVKSDF